MTVIEERTGIHAPIERCFDLARSVEVHLLGNIHYGEQAVATGGVTTGLVGLGERVTWRAKHFGLWRQLTSEITQLERPVFFQAAQVHGIFGSMRHDHLFRALSPDRTEMRDVFAFAAPSRSSDASPRSRSWPATCELCFASGVPSSRG